MNARTTKVTVYEDSGAFLMKRVQINDGSVAQQADIASIAYSVHDQDDLDNPATGTLTVANVFFDTLQTDSRWDEDTTGYNFGWAAPKTLFPTGDRVLEAEVVCTPVVGEDFVLHFTVEVLRLRGS